MAQTEADASMAPFFALALLALVLFPFTWWKASKLTRRSKRHFRVREASSQWGKIASKIGRKSAKPLHKRAMGFLSASNLLFALLWLGFILLLWHIRNIADEKATFEPYSILGLEQGASDSEVRRAYRELSRKYHPDKNPDPKAQMYFADKITKAYEALTDEESKKNYELYGHPDGRQGLDFGVALPQFFFDKEGRMAPILLVLIVGVGVLLPLGAAVAYLLHSSRYSSGKVLQKTLVVYAMGLSERMNAERVLDVFVRAQEFIDRPMQNGEWKALEHLSKVTKESLEAHSGKRKTSPQVIRSKMICRAQLQQESHRIPDSLWGSYAHLAEKAPMLISALVNLCLHPPPEKSRMGYGFLQPALATLHFSACLSQGVPLTHEQLDKYARKHNKGKQWHSLMQVPHMTATAVKDLIHRHSVRTAWDLTRMPPSERREALAEHMSEQAVADVEDYLLSMPFVAMSASVRTEGEEEMYEGDVVTCTVRAAVCRCRPGSKGKKEGNTNALQWQPPIYPADRGETWWAVLADAGSQTVLASDTLDMPELPFDGEVKQLVAEGEGPMIKCAKPKEEGDDNQQGDGEGAKEEVDSEEEGGLRLEGRKEPAKAVLKFRPPRPGFYRFEAHVVSDVWVGCDVSKEMPAEVLKQREEEPRRLTGKERRAMKKRGESALEAGQRLPDGTGTKQEAEGHSEPAAEDEEDLEDMSGTEESEEGAESEADYLLSKGAEDEVTVSASA